MSFLQCSGAPLGTAITWTIIAWLSNGWASPLPLPTTHTRSAWKTTQYDHITLRCGPWKSSKWCEAKAILPAPIDTVLTMLVDVEALPRLFPSMMSMKRIAPDTYHQVIDYPFPYNDRDLVLAFSQSWEDSTHIIEWHSVDGSALPSVGVRLTQAQGRFELRSRADGRTDITYVWHGDVGPGVPEWIWPLAWRNQSREVVSGMISGLRPPAATP